MFPRAIRVSLTHASLAGLAVLLLAAPRAQATNWATRADEYCRPMNTAPRVVTETVEGRRIRRILVPVLAESADSAQRFVNAFLKPSAMVVYARPYNSATYPYNYYVRLLVPPEKGKNFSAADGALKFNGDTWTSYYDNDYVNDLSSKNKSDSPLRFLPQLGSRYVVLQQKKTSVTHTRGFLNQYHNDGQFRTAGERHAAACQAEGRLPGNYAADCMWWLTNLEVKTKDGRGIENIMQNIGSRRTKGPQEIPCLAIHGAKNEHVPVIGIAVNSVEEFQAMSDDALLGPKPTQGRPVAARAAATAQAAPAAAAPAAADATAAAAQ